MGGGEIFGGAIVAFAFGAAGIIVWLIDSSVANTLCSNISSFTMACRQVMNTAGIAFFLGIAALLVGGFLIVMALKS